MVMKSEEKNNTDDERHYKQGSLSIKNPDRGDQD